MIFDARYLGAGATPPRNPGGRRRRAPAANLRRFSRSGFDWCRRHRHQPVAAQHRALTKRIQVHFNFFGGSGNYVSLLLVVEQVKRAFFKWLRRRSQRKRLTWTWFSVPSERAKIKQLTMKKRKQEYLAEKAA
jgi:hypothetical protein